MLSIGEGWEEENGKLVLMSNNANESCTGVAKKILGIGQKYEETLKGKKNLAWEFKIILVR